jgi:hypothetical protein
MKTMRTTTYVYNSSELTNKINETVSKIDANVKQNNFQVSGDLSKISSSNLQEAISNLSKKGLKKINRAILRFECRNTMRSTNLFLHYVMKDILKSDERIKISPSVKEISIHVKREAWKNAQKIAAQLLKEYKEEKGDFYKSVKV